MNNTEFEKIVLLEKRLTSSSRRRLAAKLAHGSCKLLWYVTFLSGKLLSWTGALMFCLTVTLPLFLFLGGRRLATGKPIFRAVVVYGRWGRPLRVHYFNFHRYYLRNASLFVDVLLNRLDLIGISIRRYNHDRPAAGDAGLLASTPGVFNLWYIRNATRIAHGGRYRIEMEYLHHKSPLGDLLLILKSIPAALFHQEAEAYHDKINLFGIEFMNLRMDGAVEMLADALKNGVRKMIFFVNPYCLNTLTEDPDYYQALQQADAIFPDGIGVNLACRIIGTPLRENVNGTDMLPFICQIAVKNHFTIFLLGAKPGIAAQMKKNLEKQFSGIKIIGEQHGYFHEGEETEQVFAAINRAAPDILLVAFGVPKQEKWLVEHSRRLQVRIAMAVGGLFDFYSGTIPRAPVWMRELGMEWLYRMWQEPRRMWQRYLIGNPVFIFRVIKWKMFAVQKRGEDVDRTQS